MPREERVDAPAFASRRLSPSSGPDDYELWLRHMRVASDEAKFHHNLYNVFPPSRYRLSNPEFYPVHTDGVRYPEVQYVGACKEDASKCKAENHTWQPVLRAEGLLEEGIANVRQYLDEHPDESWFSLGINDSLVWGEEQMAGWPDNSLHYTHMSDVYFPWVNELVTEVLQTHPNRRFGLLAYTTLQDPPQDALHDSVVPFITYDRMQWAHPGRRARQEAHTLSWLQKAKEIGWYDYVYGDQVLGNLDRPLYAAPRFYPHLMAEYLRFGWDNGVRHYYAEAYPSTQYWREGPKLYVLAKLLWNPDLDVDALLDDWYGAAVGPGAPYLREYYEFWEEFWTKHVPDTPWFMLDGRVYLDFTSDELVYPDLTASDRAFLEEQMDAVVLATPNTPYEARADFFYRAWEQVQTEVFDPLQAQEEFRADGVADGYTLFFEDAIEGADGKLPEGWGFWNRENVGCTVRYAGLTQDHAVLGDSSFGMGLSVSGVTASGDWADEAYALLHRSLPIDSSSASRYCVRVKVRSPDDAFVLQLSFLDSGSTHRHRIERLIEPTGTDWRTEAVCNEVPAAFEIEKIGIFIGMRTGSAVEHDMWVDAVEVFAAP